MPSRWEIVIEGAEAASVRLEHLHAVVSRWLDSAGTHRNQDKPYSVCPAREAPGAAIVEIGLLDDALADRLAATASTKVRFGPSTYSIAGPPKLVGNEPWAQLAHTTRTTAWCLRFVTATTFRRRNACVPNPAPRAILGSLRRSWRTFAPPPLADIELDLDADPVFLTDIDIASHIAELDGRVVSGFVGRLRIGCDAAPQVSAEVDSLVRLAPYAGVGAHTTWGFGMTRPEPTWPTNRTTPTLGATTT